MTNRKNNSKLYIKWIYKIHLRNHRNGKNVHHRTPQKLVRTKVSPDSVRTKVHPIFMVKNLIKISMKKFRYNNGLTNH